LNLTGCVQFSVMSLIAIRKRETERAEP